jgi:hypothetical protein
MSDDLVLAPDDEYFGHQTALPLRVVASSDRGWRERYWISVFDTIGTDFVLSMGYGKYPNRDVMDGFCVAAKDGLQRNLRVSRELGDRFNDISVGPMSVEIIEPLKKLKFLLGENETGTSLELLWEASVPAALEGRHFEVNRGRVSHDLIRYVQTGCMRGHINFNGERMDVTPDRWWGVRDHSWGVRPMSAVPGDPPVASVQWNFLAFCPIRFPSFSIHFYLFESEPGRPTHLSASIMRPEGSGKHDDGIKAVTHDFEWDENAPVQTLRGGAIRIEFFSGQIMDLLVEACKGRAYLRGGGYGSTQGKWLGVSHTESEAYDLTDAEALKGYHSHSSDHLIKVRCGDQTGFGIIEYLIRRGYTKYSHALPPRKPAGA